MNILNSFKLKSLKCLFFNFNFILSVICLKKIASAIEHREINIFSEILAFFHFSN